MIKTAVAVFKKNYINTMRGYPFSFMLSRVIMGITTILYPYLIYTFYMKDNINDSFFYYNNSSDYLTYIVLGAALNILGVSTLMNVGRSIITEIRQGTIEPMLLTNSSDIGYFIGCLLEQCFRAIIEFVIVLIVGILLGARIAGIFQFSAIICIMVSIISFFSMSILLCSIMVKTRDTYICQNTLFIIMSFTCGVSFPIEYLPKFLQCVSYIFPLTSAIKLYRLIIINNETILNNLPLLIHMISLSFIYFCIGYIWYLSKLKNKIIEVEKN